MLSDLGRYLKTVRDLIVPGPGPRRQPNQNATKTRTIN